MNWLQKIASPIEWLRSQGVADEILQYALDDNKFPRKLQKWVALRLNKIHKNEHPNPQPGEATETIQRNERYLIEIRDWFRHKTQTEHGFNINSFPDISSAMEQADIWQSEMAEDRGEGHAKFYTQPDYNAEDLGNGFRMVEVVPDDLENEGAIMQHCVGDDSQDYKEKVESGKSKIFSLRDSRGWPHATIEVHNQNEFDIEDFDNDPENWVYDDAGNLVDIDYEAYGDRTADWAIEQIQGKQNEPPVDKYKPYLKGWLGTHKEEFSISDADMLSVTSDVELLPMIFNDPSNEKTFKNIVLHLSPEGKSQVMNQIISDKGEGWNTKAIMEMLSKMTSMYPYGGTDSMSSDDASDMRKSILSGFLSMDYNDLIRTKAMGVMSIDLIGAANRDPQTKEWLKNILMQEESSPGVAYEALNLLTDQLPETPETSKGQFRSNYYNQYADDVLPIALNVSERFKDHPSRGRLQGSIANAASRSNVDTQTLATLFERSIAEPSASTYEVRTALGKLDTKQFYEMWQLLSTESRNRLMRDDSSATQSGIIIFEQLNNHQFALEEWSKYQYEMDKYNNNVKHAPRLQPPDIQPPVWQDQWVRTPENDQMRINEQERQRQEAKRQAPPFQPSNARMASNWLQRVG